MMSGIKIRLINHSTRLEESLKQLWCPISEQTNNKKIIPGCYQTAIHLGSVMCAQIWLLNRFHEVKRESTPFILILNCLSAGWWKSERNKQLNAKSKLNNKLAILINLSPTRPLSVYLKRHSTPHCLCLSRIASSSSEFIKSQSWMNQINFSKLCS